MLPVLIVILADLLAYDPTRTGLSGVGEFTERGFASLLKNFQLGKVFIYTSSYLAPAIIVIWKYNEKSDRFKEWYKFVIAISALAIISAVMYLSSSSGSTQNHTFELFLGLIIYVFSALYLYGAILEDRDIDDLIAAAKLEVNKRDKAVDGIGSDLESFNP